MKCIGKLRGGDALVWKAGERGCVISLRNDDDNGVGKAAIVSSSSRRRAEKALADCAYPRWRALAALKPSALWRECTLSGAWHVAGVAT